MWNDQETSCHQFKQFVGKILHCYKVLTLETPSKNIKLNKIHISKPHHIIAMVIHFYLLIMPLFVLVLN